MKLVIVIPKEDYNNIEPFLNGETIKGGFNLFKALEIIKNGKPLPKGHGRLIDGDNLKNCFRYAKANTNNENDMIMTARRIIKSAPTIIEADKESIE